MPGDFYVKVGDLGRSHITQNKSPPGQLTVHHHAWHSPLTRARRSRGRPYRDSGYSPPDRPVRPRRAARFLQGRRADLDPL